MIRNAARWGGHSKVLGKGPDPHQAALNIDGAQTAYRAFLKL